MKFTLISLSGLLPALLVVPLQAQGAGAPVLTTPGTATWSTEFTATGSRTVFTITGNTVLDWGQFNLASGNELVFDFVGGESVANMLGGTGANIIAGDVASNGNVAFFSPGADLLITGSVVGKSVTLAAMNADPAAQAGGGSYTLQGVGGGAQLILRGSVRATGGDVVLAGAATQSVGGAKVDASGTVLMAAASKVSVDPHSSGLKLKMETGEGLVLHLGETRASRIEIAAGSEIRLGGILDVGSKSQQIFLEIGRGGKIADAGDAIVIGKLIANKEVDRNGALFPQNEADAAGVLGDSTLKMPRVKRPDGSIAAPSRTVVSHVPMSASADGGRDRGGRESKVAKRDKPEPILHRTSFFGMRGGTPVKKP